MLNIIRSMESMYHFMVGKGCILSSYCVEFSVTIMEDLVNSAELLVRLSYRAGSNVFWDFCVSSNSLALSAVTKALCRRTRISLFLTVFFSSKRDFYVIYVNAVKVASHKHFCHDAMSLRYLESWEGGLQSYLRGWYSSSRRRYR